MVVNVNVNYSIFFLLFNKGATTKYKCLVLCYYFVINILYIHPNKLYIFLELIYLNNFFFYLYIYIVNNMLVS